MEKVVIANSPNEEKQQKLLEEVDALAENLAQGSLEFGWKVSELWDFLKEDFIELTAVKGKPREKKAVSEFVNFLSEREAHVIEKRKTIVERFRVARLFPRKTYEQIVDASGGIRPMFHQIRACVITTKGDEVDSDLTDAMINWAIENKWNYTVVDMRAKRNSLIPGSVKITPEEKRIQLFKKIAEKIMAEHAPESPWWKAAKVVIETA